MGEWPVGPSADGAVAPENLHLLTVKVGLWSISSSWCIVTNILSTHRYQTAMILFSLRFYGDLGWAQPFSAGLAHHV